MTMKNSPTEHRSRTGLWAILACCFGSISAAPLAEEAIVAVFHNGSRTILDSQAANELRKRCEAQLMSADSILRLAVSKSFIEGLRRQGLAVEIEYQIPKVLAKGNRTIEIKRLLIPLSGDLAGPITTIFYGTKEYESGPYRNSRGSEELLNLVQELGLDKR